MVVKRDLFLGLLVITVWAANTVAIKFITIEVTPFVGLAIRLFLGSIIFAPFFRWQGKQKFWLITQIIMLLAVLHWGSLIWSIDKLEASMASILLQTQVIFTTLLGYFIFKERFGWRTFAGIAMGIAGVAILVGLPQNPPSMIGVIGMAFSMLSIALAYARMKSLSDIAPLNYMAHMHIIAVIPVTIIALLIEKPLQTDWSGIDYTILIPALLYQVFIVAGAHMLWQRLMTRNKMSGLPNLSLLLPVIGVTFSILLLGETITPAILIGGTITTVGVGIVMLRKQKHHRL